MNRLTQVKSITAFDSRIFKGLNPEIEQPERKPLDVKENTVKQELLDLLDWLYSKVSRYEDREKIMKILKEKLAKMEFSAKDVELFSFSINDFPKGSFVNQITISDTIGLFLTALADKVSPEWVTIHVSHMPNEPNLLGYESVGNIIVNGDVGRNTGLRSKGSMIINGNVKGDIASEFQGVSIHVKGDAESAAREMKKGRVTIDGNTKHAVADGMTGGTLILNGDISKLSKEIWGGKIIRRGVMLVYKGERRDVKKTIYEDYE